MDFIDAEKLKSFDAFPKVSSNYSVRSTRGGMVTILLGIISVFFIWVQLGSYFDGYEDQKFSVFDSVQQVVQLNVDITVAIPCQYLHTHVFDATRDTHVAYELLKYESTNFPDNKAYTEIQKDSESLNSVLKRAKKSDFKAHDQSRIKSLQERTDFRRKKDEPVNPDEASSCRVFGSINVNHVKGDFHITAKGYGYRDRIYTPREALNFTHYIDELSFGEYYPKLENPLDETAKKSTHDTTAFQYFLSIVPTTYHGYTNNRFIQTNQYAVTEQTREYAFNAGVPGIFFRYEFEPIELTITDKRMPFLQFLVRLVNTLGGITVSIAWLYRLFDTFIVKVFGKRYQGEVEEKGGLLDISRHKGVMNI